MKSVVEWILFPSRDFDATVAFLRTLLGLNPSDQGTPKIDEHFRRFATFENPNGLTIEVVEPHDAYVHQYTAPIPSFTVDDLIKVHTELESQGIELLTSVFGAEDWGWFYVRAPGGSTYQIQGPLD